MNNKKLIAKVRSNLNNSIFDIDNIKYLSNFNYLKSGYSNQTFPEFKDINIFQILSKPEKNSSSKTKSEIEEVSRLSNNRTLEEIKLVYSVDDDPFDLFKLAIKQHNLNFNYSKFKQMYYETTAPLIDHLKFYYNRARPFQLASKLDIPINILTTSTHQTPSYPSGHTSYAALIGAILSESYPEKSSIFKDLVQKCGQGRVLQGVHYPSDNLAALRLIKTIYPYLKKHYEKL